MATNKLCSILNSTYIFFSKTLPALSTVSPCFHFHHGALYDIRVFFATGVVWLAAVVCRGFRHPSAQHPRTSIWEEHGWEVFIHSFVRCIMYYGFPTAPRYTELMWVSLNWIQLNWFGILYEPNGTEQQIKPNPTEFIRPAIVTDSIAITNVPWV